MPKKLVLTEIQKVNILGKGLLQKIGPTTPRKGRGKPKRPRYDRRKDEE